MASLNQASLQQLTNTQQLVSHPQQHLSGQVLSNQLPIHQQVNNQSEQQQQQLQQTVQQAQHPTIQQLDLKSSAIDGPVSLKVGDFSLSFSYYTNFSDDGSGGTVVFGQDPPHQQQQQQSQQPPVSTGTAGFDSNCNGYIVGFDSQQSADSFEHNNPSAVSVMSSGGLAMPLPTSTTVFSSPLAPQLVSCISTELSKSDPVPHVGEATTIQCDVCKAELRTSQHLAEHKSAQHGLLCDVCKLQFAEESQLLSHNKTVHGGSSGRGQLKQSKHSQLTDKKEEAVNLSPVKSKTTLRPTSQPPTQPQKTTDLAILQETLEAEPFPYQCVTCNHKLATKTELAAHLDEHNQAKPYKCSVCGLGFTFQSARKRHELATHPSDAESGLGPRKPHSCNQCKKAFARRSDLTSHQTRMHAPSQSKSNSSSTHPTQISCQNCAQMFTSEKDVKRHACTARDKTAPKDTSGYSCPICGQVLERKVEWGAHMWKHTKNAKYIVTSEKDDLPVYSLSDVPVRGNSVLYLDTRSSREVVAPPPNMCSARCVDPLWPY